MTAERAELMAGNQVPEADGPPELPGPRRLLALRLLDHDRRIAAPRGQPASVGVEREAGHALDGVRKCDRIAGTAKVPRSDGSIGAGRRQPGTVRTIA